MLRRNVNSFLKVQLLPVDTVFAVLVSIVIFFGLLMVYEASVIYSDKVFGGKYHFLLLQFGWVLIGFIGMYFLSRLDLQLVKKYSPYLFGITLLFLVFVLLPTPFAPERNGARRWIVLNPAPLPSLPVVGRLSFQPSELAKVVSVVFFAAFLSSPKILQRGSLSLLRNFSVALILVCGLVLLEPDFTTSFVVALILISMYFVANGPLLYFLVGGPAVAVMTVVYALSSDYRKARIRTLFDPESMDKLGAGYHIHQIMIALGSGGLFGLGFGRSRQKYAYLPEVTADSIFAVIGEEFGFIGTLVLVLLFALLIWRGIKIAQNSQDRFSAILVSGVTIWIAVQTLINLGAMVRLLPLTGVPLPLVSYGGSSTIFMMWGLGLVLNVSRGLKLK